MTKFIDNATLITADWLNQVDSLLVTNIVGAKGDGIADDTAALQATLNYVSSQGGGTVVLPFGQNFKITSTILIPSHVILRGVNKEASKITVASDVVGIRVIGTNSTLKDFRLNKSGTHTNNGIEVGDLTNNARETVIDGVHVDGVGRDGIQIRQGNLGTLRDVSCTNPGRHGVCVTNETPDTNAWKIDGVLEVSNCGGKGFYLQPGTTVSDPNAGRSWYGGLIVAQSCIGYGVHVGTRSNYLTAYSENNGTYQIYLDTLAAGNVIMSVEGAVYDSTPGNFNSILNPNANASYWREFQGKTLFAGGSGNGVRISNSDGTAGYADMEKVGSADYRLRFGGTGQTFIYTIENTSPGQTVDGRVGGNWNPSSNNTGSLGTPVLTWNTASINTLNAGSSVFSQQPVASTGLNLSFGAKYSASATAGGGQATPATVLGFITAYQGTTQIKIPFYAA